MNTQYAIRNTLCIIIVSTAFVLSGCVVRTYQVTKNRVDQDLAGGNRGYLAGKPSSEEVTEKKTTRTMRVVEVELHSPIKFETKSKRKTAQKTPETKIEDQEVWGNQGYISRDTAPAVEPKKESFEKYTVKNGDTLQKISQKFFGTTKKWMKIYDANRDTLKSPNKVYPGKTINIPIEPTAVKEPKENLK